MKALNPSTGQFEEVYVKALDSLPVGIILEFPTTDSSKLPSGYMFCDGSAISRTEYSELFGLIGTSYGSGDGSTTFNLPTKEGLVSVGIKSSDTDFNTIGKTGGSKYLQEHTHNGGSLDSGGTPQFVWDGSRGSQNAAVTTSAAGTGHSGNLQPYIVTNYIIKVKQTRPLAASVVNTYSESTENAYSCDYINNNFQLKGTVLYNDSTGSAGNITLSDSITNYNYIEVYFRNNDGTRFRGCQKMNVTAETMTVSLVYHHLFNNEVYLKAGEVTLNGTSLSFLTNYQLISNNNGNNVSSGTFVYVTKVVGYK